MPRLTFEGNFCDIAMCRENPCPYNGMCSQRQTWERLKQYEDAGLEPEEIEDAVIAAKLMARSKIVSCFGVDADHVRDLVEAEQDGRLVVLQEGGTNENSGSL